MVMPALKKEAAGYLQEQQGLSQRKAALLVNSAPKVLLSKSRRSSEEAIKTRLRELAQQPTPLATIAAQRGPKRRATSSASRPRSCKA